MIVKKSAELLPLTRELALHVANMMPLPGERELKPSRVAFFQTHLERQTFASPTWSTCVVKDSGREYRADGQHTSHALSQTSEEQFPPGLTVTLQHFEIDSIELDAAKLFDLFDNPKSVRSNLDAIGIYLCRHRDVDSLSRSFTVKVTHAVDSYLREMAKRELDEAKRPIVYPSREHGLYLENEIYRKFALWLHDWFESKNAWIVNKTAVVVEILSEWITHEEAATVFWNYVFTETHPDVTHESRELADSLNDLRRKPRIGPEHFRTLTKRHWTRFRRSRDYERQTQPQMQAASTQQQPAA
jgi:hypothetical protein